MIDYKGHLSISKRRIVAPYGEIVGYASSNVPAYSNANDDYSAGRNSLYGVTMGAKWQCVEYARRWLFLQKGCVFDDVDDAADIWDLEIVQRVADKKCFNFIRHPDGSLSPPQNESLLIYARSNRGIPYGHVAVIVDVSPTFIRVAEQNYDRFYWEGNYARQIPYKLIRGRYYIQDYYTVIGWMTIEFDKETKPLDRSTIDQIIQWRGASPDFRCRH